MTTVFIDVLITCLEEFYLLFLLGKEEVKSRVAEAFLFCILVAAIALMSYFGVPVLSKITIHMGMIIAIGGFVYDVSRIKLGFYVIIYMVISYISEVLVIVIWGFLDKPVLSVNLVYEDFRISLIIVAKALNFFMLYIFRTIINVNRQKISRYELFPAILTGVSFIVVVTIVNTNIMYIPTARNKMFLLVGDAGVLMAFIINIIFTERYIKKMSEAEKQKMMQLELQYQYYVEKKEDMDYIRQIYHDLKNHLLLVERRKITSQIDDRIKVIEDYYETGNEFLDVIISDKMKIASKKHIHLECDIDFRQGYFIQPLDISAIFGNLLDNAIEATEKLDEDEKYILCKASPKRKLLIILVQNKFDETKDHCSRKKSYLHGFGLKNVQDSVKKYNGNCSIDKESDIFRISIVLPIPEEKNKEL